MLVMPYDTESTGLPVWEKPSADPCQPRITQICAELFDDVTGQVHGVLHTLIKPDGWVIPDDVAALNGITTLKCEAHGLPMKNILSVLLDMWRRAELRIGHNEGFDMRMVRIEIFRAGGSASLADGWKGGASFCTRNKSLPYLDDKKKGTNLADVYKHLIGRDLVGAHNAVVDVMATKAIYQKLKLLNGHEVIR